MLGMFTTISGRVCGHYEMGGRIGTGAMGDVYKARDVHLDRVVAIKVLPHWARGDPNARARFKTEARAASALNHPNIVTVYEIFEHDGIDLLAMEYLPGPTLQTLIPVGGFPLSEALARASEVAQALSAAHAAGILHRDLKPGNVLIASDGRCKLTDFGIAEMLHLARGTDARTASNPAGTRAYMAPEQLAGEVGDQRSEIFSFGVILHQLLSGQHPFQRDAAINIEAIRTQRPAQLPSRTPIRLVQLIDTCLEKDPARRYPSIQDVLTDLTRCAQREDIARDVRTSNREIARLLRLIRRMRYGNLADSRAALADIRREIARGLGREELDSLVSHLKGMIMTVPDFGNRVVPAAVREIRRLILDALRIAVDGELDRHFQTRDLEHLDLYGMNFMSCRMKGLSFQQSFLATANVQNAVLVGASFSGAWLRNVDFRNADTREADFTDADWFNALNLTESHVAAIRRGTLMPCPDGVAKLRRWLDARYGFPFDSWGLTVRDQLTATWATYLRPGGLRDIVGRL